jgi:hypothetical protein
MELSQSQPVQVRWEEEKNASWRESMSKDLEVRRSMVALGMIGTSVCLE